MILYETGEIDVTGISLSYLDRVTDRAGPFYQELGISPELSLSYIGFSYDKPPFDDANIRLAFSRAVDKDRIISLVTRDMLKRADGILPPGMPGFNEDLTGIGYDINEAKRLIASSSYGDVSRLPPITITTSGRGGAISRALEAIIYEWQQNLGVEVRVRQLEPERFIYNLKEERDEIFFTGWIADYPHPQNFLQTLFYSDLDNNFGAYANSEVDALLDRAGVEQDEELSLELYRQAEQKIINDAGFLPLWFGQNYILVKPYVKGYHLSPLGIPQLGDVSIEPH